MAAGIAGYIQLLLGGIAAVDKDVAYDMPRAAVLKRQIKFIDITMKIIAASNDALNER
ncbi:hypothetical protein D3C84_1224710 [compost metagenome]